MHFGPAGLCSALALAAPAHAQTITWSSASGPWNDPANWSPMNVPDAPHEHALLGGSGAYTVFLKDWPPTVPPVSPSIGALRITNPLAVLSVDFDMGLTVGGDVANDGVIDVNPQYGELNPTTLHFTRSALLSGTGEVRLRAAGFRSLLSTAPGATLTNGPGHTIRGMGGIEASLVNNGTIMADATLGLGTGWMTLEASDKVNNGLITCTGQSELEIDGITISQSPDAAIHMSGGRIVCKSATIVGGRLSSEGIGYFVTSGATMLESVTFDGDLLSISGMPLVVRGAGLTNHAVARLLASLRFEQPGTLDGTGEARLDMGGLIAAPGVPITHEIGHDITGAGPITAHPLINRGRIAPGLAEQPIGIIFVSGEFSNDPSGVLDIQIGGPGTADRLGGTAAYTLAGTLRVSLLYEPRRLDRLRIIQGQSVQGRFATVVMPQLPHGVAMRVMYLPGAVEVWFHCPPDLTGGSAPGLPGYGLPDGALTSDDFFYYLGLFAAGDPDADLTASAIAGQAGYGVPNGMLNANDFFYYLALFAAGC